jgi:hypothetical protein
VWIFNLITIYFCNISQFSLPHNFPVNIAKESFLKLLKVYGWKLSTPNSKTAALRKGFMLYVATLDFVTFLVIAVAISVAVVVVVVTVVDIAVDDVNVTLVCAVILLWVVDLLLFEFMMLPVMLLILLLLQILLILLVIVVVIVIVVFFIVSYISCNVKPDVATDHEKADFFVELSVMLDSRQVNCWMSWGIIIGGRPTSWSQFHQHFLRIFCTNILTQTESTNLKFKYKKAACETFELKM